MLGGLVGAALARIAGPRGEKEDGAVGTDTAVVAEIDTGDPGDGEGADQINIDDLAEGALRREGLASVRTGSRDFTYLADGAQGQGVVERITDVEDIGCRHDGRHNVIDALEGLKGAVEESQHGVVLSHVDGMEDGAGRHTRFVGGRPRFAAFFGEGLTVGAVQITDADIGTTLAAEPGQSGTETVGTAGDEDDLVQQGALGDGRLGGSHLIEMDGWMERWDERLWGRSGEVDSSVGRWVGRRWVESVGGKKDEGEVFIGRHGEGRSEQAESSLHLREFPYPSAPPSRYSIDCPSTWVAGDRHAGESFWPWVAI